MQKLISAVLAASLMASTAAFAQTTTPATPPASPAPSAAEKKIAPPTAAGEVITLTDEQAKGLAHATLLNSRSVTTTHDVSLPNTVDSLEHCVLAAFGVHMCLVKCVTHIHLVFRGPVRGLREN